MEYSPDLGNQCTDLIF